MVGAECQLAPVLDAAFGMDLFDMAPDGVKRNMEVFAYFLICQAQPQKTEYLKLAVRESMHLCRDFLCPAYLLGLEFLDFFDAVRVPVLLPQKIIDLVSDDRENKGPWGSPAVTQPPQGQEDGKINL